MGGAATLGASGGATGLAVPWFRRVSAANNRDKWGLKKLLFKAPVGIDQIQGCMFQKGGCLKPNQPQVFFFHLLGVPRGSNAKQFWSSDSLDTAWMSRWKLGSMVSN